MPLAGVIAAGVEEAVTDEATAGVEALAVGGGAETVVVAPE